MQLGRPSGAIRIRCNASHAARCVIKRSTQWRSTQWHSMEKHSVALSGTQWHSVALSGSHLLLARHACFLLRLRRRLRLPHTQRLGGPRRLLGRPRTLQPHGLVALPCLRGNQVQLGALKGTRSQSGQSVFNQGSSRGLPLPPRPRARLSSPQPPPAASAGVPVGPGGEGGWRAVVSMGAVVSAPFSLVPGMRASAASNVCWSAFSLAAASNHMHSR